MQYVQLPDGTDVPALGMGTWYMGDHAATRTEEIKALQTGIDLGMTLIDTAEMYGNGRSETLVGKALENRRQKVFLISKVLPDNASMEGTKKACERSLKRLKTDHLDLYLLHWQGPYPYAETLEAFLQLQAEGKITHWGVSNLDTDAMKAFYSLPQGGHCTANEVLYNLSRRGIEYDLLPWCQHHQLPVIAYSPIEQGRIIANPVLREIAYAHKATAAQVALAWVLRQPGVIAIPKASKEKHIQENFGSLQISLTEKELALLEDAFPAPHRKMPLEML